MPVSYPYTLASLGAGDQRFLVRTPGLAEIERLFPSPSSSGRGRLTVEGGVSIVAGPGMGKTSLLTNLAWHLDRHRNLATVLVTLPPATDYPGEDGFYAFLGHLVRQVHAGLGASARVKEPIFSPVARVLQQQPDWDVEGKVPGMTSRGFSHWISLLGAAAVRTPGVCLLFDNVDNVTDAAWRTAFIAGLRFTFQASTGVTPVYALWTMFAEQSLSGSSYFRNVTYPVFLEPLSTWPIASEEGSCERRSLVNLGLPTLPDSTAAHLFRLVGGHPQLLHQSLADLCASIPNEASVTRITPTDLDDLFSSGADEGQRRLTSDLLSRTPALIPALRQIANGTRDSSSLGKGLLATGLVDRDSDGRSVLPVRVAEVL